MINEKKYTYNIIDNTINDNTLSNFIQANNINIKLDDESNKWFIFSFYYGRMNGLNDLESASFAFTITSLFTDYGVNIGTNIYYREETIYDDLINTYIELEKDITDEEELLKEIFNQAFITYNNNINVYEIKNRRLSIRISESDYNKFHNIEGKTLTDKFKTLLDINKKYDTTRIYLASPQTYYHNETNFKQTCMDIFEDMGYNILSLPKFEWAVNETMKYYDTDEDDGVMLAQAVERVYCLLENYEL